MTKAKSSAVRRGKSFERQERLALLKAMGRNGGKSKSAAKVKAAQENGAKGGRPSTLTVQQIEEIAGYCLRPEITHGLTQEQIAEVRESVIKSAKRTWNDNE